MASQADGNSPPRSDLVVKTRSQSTSIPDSPSRVTRSQIRRFSNAPAELPMSPKPSVTTRRRSMRVSESVNDAASQEDISSVQDETESVKPLQRPRRSTRRSFAETSDNASLPNQRSMLTSIEEDAKPVTRRTRASMKPIDEAESEISLPVARRTRRSSVSSVTSVSTIASVTSPVRRTRSRKNLSPVPSPTFSEASCLSEVPEVSPKEVKKESTPKADSGLNVSSKSSTPLSSNVSPAAKSSSQKEQTPGSAKRFSLREQSPKGDVSFTTPRQLKLDDSDSTSIKRVSFIESPSDDCNIVEVTREDIEKSAQKDRRSQGRLSLSRKSSPFKSSNFIESPLPPKEIQNEIIEVDLESSQDDKVSSSPAPEVILGGTSRRSSGRLSLPKFTVTPMKNSSAETADGNEDPNKSSKKQSATSPTIEIEKTRQLRLSLSRFEESPRASSPTKKLNENVSNLQEKSPDKSDRTSPKKDHMESSSESTGRLSLTFIKTPLKSSPEKEHTVISPTENSNLETKTNISVETGRRRTSSGRLSVSSNKSLEELIIVSPKDKSNSETKSSISEETARRTSSGRWLSVSSNKSPDLDKTQNSVGRSSLTTRNPSPSKTILSPQHNLVESSRDNTPGKRLNTSVKLDDQSLRKSLGRLSLTPGKLSSDAEAVTSPKSNTTADSKSGGAEEVASSNVVNLIDFFEGDSNNSTRNEAEDSENNKSGENLVEEQVEVTGDEKDDKLDTEGEIPVETIDLDDGNLKEFGETKEGGNIEGATENEDVEAENKETGSKQLSNSFKVNASEMTTSRRASTGNLWLQKAIESEAQRKPRASTGSLRIIGKFDDEALKMKSSATNSPSSTKRRPSNSSNTFSVDETNDEMTISPIKTDPSDVKNLTLTPSSSDDSFNETNNALEKSTVFNEAEEFFDSESGLTAEDKSLADSSRVSLNESSTTQSPKVKKSLSPVKETEPLTAVKSKNSPVSHKVYKDAAILLNGGSISDFEDEESDEKDWQPVFTPATKSKKELRMEKKARKKAEKEAKKKAKLEKEMSRLSQSHLDEDDLSTDEKDEANSPKSTPSKLSKHSVIQDLNSDRADPVLIDECSISFKPNSSKKQRDNPKILNSSLSPTPHDKASELTSSHKKFKRTSFSETHLDGSISVSNVSEIDQDTSGKNIKKDQNTSGTGVLEVDDHVSKTERDLLQAGPGSKKKRKFSEAEISNEEISEETSQSKKRKIELDSVADFCDNPDLKKKKKKKKVKKQVSEDAEELSPNKDADETHSKKSKKSKKEDLPENAANVQEEPTLKKKKKKKVEEGANSKDISGEKALKKRKKKTSSVENQLENIDQPIIKKKKKKSKTVEGDPSDTTKDLGNATDAAGAPTTKKSKKLKKLTSAENDQDEHSSEVKVKKIKKKPLSVSSSNSVLHDVLSDVMKKKKSKPKKIVEPSTEFENGSDSDDAPASVSFAAGKEAALAELHAAAENIKKQKELKKLKLKMKLEKKREQQQAKNEKLKQKLKVTEDSDPIQESSKILSLGGSSSKIYFDSESNVQKPKIPKRLPADLLESLSEQPPTKFIRRPDGTKERVAATSLSAEEKDRLERKKARILARKLEKKKLKEADYVPLEGVLGATRFGVVPLRNIMLAKKMEKNKLAEEAANFRQQSLFGNRIRRTPISSVLSHQDKLQASGKHLKVHSKSK